MAAQMPTKYGAVYHRTGQQAVFSYYTVKPDDKEEYWTCDVTLPEDPGGTLPREADIRFFLRKREAKHYAAECAVKWLRAEGWMPEDGVKFPKNTQRPYRPTTATLGSPSPEKSPSKAKDEVAALCQELGFHGPKYTIKPHDGNDLWWCRADFGPGEDLMPQHILAARVAVRMPNKNIARDTVVEKLRAVLVEEKRIRAEQNQAFLRNQQPSHNLMSLPSSAPNVRGPQVHQSSIDPHGRLTTPSLLPQSQHVRDIQLGHQQYARELANARLTSHTACGLSDLYIDQYVSRPPGEITWDSVDRVFSQQNLEASSQSNAQSVSQAIPDLDSPPGPQPDASPSPQDDVSPNPESDPQPSGPESDSDSPPVSDFELLDMKDYDPSQQNGCPTRPCSPH
ncbi:hypothetical protein F5B22DRAFT_640769 [Xylaria bambusicola]|uniref:uncharacterized protein n=1 Tax=Xylaria bambusicola TaxID=326684 RepID=UPI0020089FF4|nr:uncharacterized protein F5B22DRAFT_640769 [Xylaria bambusicola]KAI0527790.1 hypothetical protein F5B22DRAFT_640769 [Xylaria bambusicola]